MNPIRLMIITHDLAIGGLQQVVVNLCRSINREIFNVSVLCLRALGEFTPEVKEMGIKVYFLSQRERGTDYFSFLKVAKILRQEKIDVIHTHNTQPLIDGAIGALLSGRKIRIVHTDHGRIFPDKKRYMFAERIASYFTYKIVGVSEQTTNNLIKYEKIPRYKTMTITNGIDGKRFNIEIDKYKKRKELEITKHGPIIGTVTRLSEEKGIKYLLEAMQIIKNSIPDITLLIAGTGPQEAELKKYSSMLGVDDSTIFLGPRFDTPELYKLFDIFALPSISEGLPMVILESMAAGCPIIATDVGGTPTAIKNDYNGSLVKSKDPVALTAELIKLLSDAEVKNKYSENGKKIFIQKFNLETMTKKYESLYLKG